MAVEPIVNNPIGWAQLRLLGGWRKNLALCGIYAGACLLICFLMYRAMRNEVSLPTFASGAMVVFLYIQVSILLLGGTTAIKRAVHRDFTTDMISSHRLTAMSGHTAVLGYLTGPTLQVSAITLVNWLLCTGFALLAGGGPAQSSFGPSGVLVISLCFAILCWSMGVLLGLSTRGKMSTTLAIVGLGIVANAQVLHFVPGLHMLMPASLLLNLGATAAGGTVAMQIVFGMVAQLALAFTLCLAAARKFTRNDVPAFSPLLAYCLLALSALIAGVAFVVQDLNSTRYLVVEIIGRRDIQMIATITCLALVAMIPVTAAAQLSAQWVNRQAKDVHFRTVKPRPFWEAAFISSFLALGLLFVVMRSILAEVLNVGVNLDFRSQLIALSAVFVLALLTLAGVLRWTYSIVPSAAWIIVVFLVFFWVIPPLADLSLDVLLHDIEPQGRSVLFTSSPVGAWIAICSDVKAPVIPGLVVQAAIAGAALLLAARSKGLRKTEGKPHARSGSSSTAVP